MVMETEAEQGVVEVIDAWIAVNMRRTVCSTSLGLTRLDGFRRRLVIGVPPNAPWEGGSTRFCPLSRSWSVKDRGNRFAPGTEPRRRRGSAWA